MVATTFLVINAGRMLRKYMSDVGGHYFAVVNAL
jgi:hypothetical protein